MTIRATDPTPDFSKLSDAEILSLPRVHLASYVQWKQERDTARDNRGSVPEYRVGDKGGLVVIPGKGRMCSSFYINLQMKVDEDLRRRAQFIVSNIERFAFRDEVERTEALNFYRGVLGEQIENRLSDGEA